MPLNPCGKCRHVRYCDPLSEWYCSKWQRLLGYSIQPNKCHNCDIIGQDGDTREIKILFDFIMKNSYLS